MPAWLRNASVRFWVGMIIYGSLVAAAWEWLDSARPNLWWLPAVILFPIGLAVALLWRRVD